MNNAPKQESKTTLSIAPTVGQLVTPVGKSSAVSVYQKISALEAAFAEIISSSHFHHDAVDASNLRGRTSVSQAIDDSLRTISFLTQDAYDAAKAYYLAEVETKHTTKIKKVNQFVVGVCKGLKNQFDALKNKLHRSVCTSGPEPEADDASAASVDAKAEVTSAASKAQVLVEQTREEYVNILSNNIAIALDVHRSFGNNVDNLFGNLLTAIKSAGMHIYKYLLL
jgi:hypothetical protein